ncbi:MAG: homoserine dehydrogenase [Meiothermus sp.]|uniref:homoserine dehydrogenase n=1 Tax=Meiothermus sp. TaxID=1955249 RepID=UPI00298F2D62|nr:homoserine dehydrogenase [Meiothermus sp.]MCX7739931.1 homoserine dehydrogenase [Meiothermus sp.]MDW8480771.1 homoserine dehydrogenase [Meiothermus sp.]
MKTVRVALLGAGTVGQAWVGLLSQHQDRLAALGVRLELARVLVRDAQRSRPAIPSHLLTTDPKGFLEGVEVLVEVAGGTGRVGDLVLEALSRGLPVITANKALLAERWGELRPYAEGGQLYYEASVMAGTPVLGALQSLWGNRTQELHGIVNGTCSYLIRRMEEGAGYQKALEEARQLGYLEADPRLDVGGIDAAHKICVLGRLTADPALEWSQVLQRTRGIEHLTPEALAEARRSGQAIRLVASLYPEGGSWVAAVRPVRLPLEHPLVLLGSGRNALMYRGEPIGTLYFAGAGAGGAVTASAVMDDLYRWLSGAPGHLPIPRAVPTSGLEVERLEEA